MCLMVKARIRSFRVWQSALVRAWQLGSQKRITLDLGLEDVAVGGREMGVWRKIWCCCKPGIWGFKQN